MTRISSRPSTKPQAHGFSLGISMGSANHSGQIFSAIIDWVNEFGFEFGIIDLSDTLNRYSLMLDGTTENAAAGIARQQGDAWLQNNLSQLRSLQVPFKIIRWDNWLNDPRYPSIVKEIELIVEENLQFRSTVYADIANFYARKGHACTAYNARLSMQYLIEEMAAHTLLHSDHDVTTIYPGKQLETYKLIRSGAVRDFPSGIDRSSYIRLIPHEAPAWSDSGQFLGAQGMALGQRKA